MYHISVGEILKTYIMTGGSLIKLAKPYPRGDVRLAQLIGNEVPEREMYYTISAKGVFMMYCYIQKQRVPTIEIEELKGLYDPSYFREVQTPMRINIDQLLSS